MFTVNEMNVLALRSLATDETPEGMADATDTHERERLAVSFIRRIKDAEGMEPETERETFAEVERVASTFSICGRVSTFLRSIARAEVANRRHYISMFPQPDTREPFAFYRAKFVNVNGETLKLKWRA